ncbi:Capsid protein VP4 [Popillia japonica]|uniref:Capsid protein VP4 n=1 Tax=Popillia japonica TaxID=7064 RepID=A0AAW1HTX0_POPJA
MKLIISPIRTRLTIEHISALMFIKFNGANIRTWKPEYYVRTCLRRHRTADDTRTRRDTRNTHSLFGFLGLAGKYLFEKKFGQVYPGMPRKLGGKYGKTTGELTSGQRAYAERQRQLGRDYQLARQRGFTGSWIDWLRTRGDRTTQVPPLEVVTPFSPQRERPVPFETQQEEPQAGPSRQVDDSSHLEGMEHIFDESMNIDDGTRETRGVTGGGGVSNPIGSTESANKHLSIPRSLGLHKYTFRFSKSRIFYTYGYSFKQITKKQTVAVTDGGVQDLGDYVYMITPLATLPVDMIGFYMDYAEANMIFGKIKILQTNVTVVPQGIRTAFDYGTTLSGTATSEHCSIGCSGIGLNNQLYCTHGALTSTSDKPMIPTDITGLNNQLYCTHGALTSTSDKPMIPTDITDMD